MARRAERNTALPDRDAGGFYAEDIRGGIAARSAGRGEVEHLRGRRAMMISPSMKVMYHLRLSVQFRGAGPRGPRRACASEGTGRRGRSMMAPGPPGEASRRGSLQGSSTVILEEGKGQVPWSAGSRWRARGCPRAAVGGLADGISLISHQRMCRVSGMLPRLSVLPGSVADQSSRTGG